jgi:hypothetical protein
MSYACPQKNIKLSLSPCILVTALADNGPPIQMVFQKDEQQPKHDDERGRL